MISTYPSSPEKSLSPQPFNEPVNMMTIELNKSGYVTDDTEAVPDQKIAKSDVGESTRKLFLWSFVFILSLFSLYALFILIQRGYAKNSYSIAINKTSQKKEWFWNIAPDDKQKFLEFQTEDYCHIYFKENFFTGIGRCTWQKVLSLVFTYEQQINQRQKRQEYEMYNDDQENQDYYQEPPPQEYSYQNEYFLPVQDYPYPEEATSNQRNPYDQNSYPDDLSLLHQEEKQYHTPMSNQRIVYDQNYDLNQLEGSSSLYAKYNHDEKNVNTPEPILQQTPHEKKTSKNANNKNIFDSIVKQSPTVLPKACPSAGCPTVINVTTQISNITKIKAEGRTLKISMNDTNIRLTPSVSNKQRISQGNDFGKTTMEMQPLSQSKQVNPCLVQLSSPFIPPYRSSGGYDMNSLFGVMPNVPHQPLYVINPPVYPYIPLQYPGYGSYQSSQLVNKNPVQIAGAGGQYYLCNPLNPSSSNIAGLQGVEVRMSESYTLQDLVAAVPKPSKSNKTREAIDCPDGERACIDGTKCIHHRQVCDNEVNCADGSDEMDCSCKDRVGEIRLCDGYLDCPNGEDEVGCFDCRHDEFSCDDWSRFQSGTCVSVTKRCDGIKDCEITGKDEEDCSILTDHLGHHSFYKVSNAAGFLHRNYKGKWYPTCFGVEIFSLDICRTEAGPSDIMPKTHLVETNDNYPGSFLDVGHNGDVILSRSCLQNKAAFVECPPLFCGLRLTINNPFRASEIDTSAEELVDHMKRFSKGRTPEVVGSTRVVGGKPSQPTSWPWIVSIYKNGIFHCGGVLINELWILTAAHCVSKFWFFYYEVQAGMLRRFSYSPMEQIRWATVAIPHENYDKKSLKNDIALMKLSKPVRFNRYIRPICLPSEATAGADFLKGPKANSICITVGWGATVEHGTDPDHLREVEIPILPSCKHREDREGEEICAGLLEGGKDACQGDSGGPLMCQNEKNRSQWYLAGIVSHGEGCARPNEPGVYTKVSKFVGWIGENINGKVTGRVPLQKCPGYVCQGTKKCLPKKRRCDKIVDCLFGDDELNCWQNNGHSLFRSETVGGTRSSSAEDFLELLTLSKPENIGGTATGKSKNGSNWSQGASMFRCRNMLQVIPIEEKCNKVVNCEDGTDESDCLCVDYLRRLHPEAICDGVTDCKDLSDEADCVKCLPAQHLCRLSQACISLNSRCDGKATCAGGEDEWDCVALTDGTTLALDSDLRPKQSMKGIITINRFGVWRPLCTNTDKPASIAANVCNLLGFEEYTEFHKLSVTDKPLNVTIDGFQHHYFSLELPVCTGLYISCFNASLPGITQELHRDNVTSEVELYTLPWTAIIYADGRFRCIGTILNQYWIMAAADCLQEVTPTNHYLAALLGKGKAHLTVEGPHEQALPISEISFTRSNEAIILRVQQKIYFNRYVKPTPAITRSIFIKEKCVAISFVNERSQLVFLQSMKNCTPGFRCFQSMDSSCKNTTERNGVIACDSREGWYPAATYSNVKTSCDFAKREFPTIKKTEIQLAMGDDHDAVVPQECDGFRCILGQCVDQKRVCDGISDCRSGEDEDSNLCQQFENKCHLFGNCTNHFCKLSEFRCKNGKCVSKTSFCNSFNDCGDNSDEPGVCSCRTYLQQAHPEKICDGTVNCWDRSDEHPKICKCKFPNIAPCGQTQLCVSMEMVCDGFVDCPGGEDESTCYGLKTTLSRIHSGEVMRRTAGVWHSGCFGRNHTTSELEEICERLGFTGGSAVHLKPQEDTVARKPVRDRFDFVWIRRGNKKLRLRLRTGNEPYLKFIDGSDCHKLFIECL